MKKGTFVWISRHPLSAPQRAALKDRGFKTIIEAGDANAFSEDALSKCLFAAINSAGINRLDVDAVGVVHPAAALILHSAGYTVAVSRNINRSPDGARPQFEFSGWEFF